MKGYKWLVLSLVIILSGIAFIPVLAFPWQEKVDWKGFALAYQVEPVIFYVNTTDDAYDASLGDGICKTSLNNCSLRAAIAEANLMEELEADVIIDLPPGVYSLFYSTSGGAHLYIARESIWPVTIRGSGSDQTIIEGNGSARIFNIKYTAVLKDMTIQHGQQHQLYGYGGAISIFDTSMLTLINAIVKDSQAQYGGGISVNTYSAYSYLYLENTTIMDNSATYGGGIFSSCGNVTIRNSTVNNNFAEVTGGGIDNVACGLLVLENTTISGNEAAYGGGIHQFGNYSEANIYNTTLRLNQATGAGGGGIELDAEGGILILSNSIVAGNHSNTAPDCSTPSNGIFSNGYNLLGSTVGCSANMQPTDLINVDGMLGPLQSNGGPTQTHKLLAGSPAIDAGNPYGCLNDNEEVFTVDQRGYPRPGYPGDTRCDIGAYEWAPSWPVYLPIITR